MAQTLFKAEALLFDKGVAIDVKPRHVQELARFERHLQPVGPSSTSVDASLSEGKSFRRASVVINVGTVAGRDVQLPGECNFQQARIHARIDDIINIRERDVIARCCGQTGIPGRRDTPLGWSMTLK